MYEFHYDYIKNKYAKNSRLLFTDTDKIKTRDGYEDSSRIKKYLILVVIRLIKDTMMIQTNYSMAK